MIFNGAGRLLFLWASGNARANLDRQQVKMFLDFSGGGIHKNRLRLEGVRAASGRLPHGMGCCRQSGQQQVRITA